MANYQCPACGKQHQGELPEVPRQVECLRCGRPFSISAPPVKSEKLDEPTLEETSAQEEPTTAETAITTAPKRSAKKRRAPTPSPDEEGATEPETAPQKKDSTDPKKKTSDPKKPPAKKTDTPERKRGRAYIFGGASVLAIAILAVSVYAFWPRTPAKKQVKKKAEPVAAKEEPAEKEPAEKEKEKEKSPKTADPDLAKPRVTAFRYAAPRLAMYLSSEPRETNSLLAGQMVEVTGLFQRLEFPGPPRPPAPPKEGEKAKEEDERPPQPRAYFQNEGLAIACEIPTTPVGQVPWKKLKASDLITVQGIYDRDGILREGMLVPFTPGATERFLGKTIEVNGVIESLTLNLKEPTDFPTMLLEKETDGLLKVECVFPKSSLVQLTPLKPGRWVSIRGICSGPQHTGDKHMVRIDNCSFVQSTSPIGGAERMRASDLTRAYEEDLRPFLKGLPGAEPRVEKPTTVQALNEEFGTSTKMLAKYRLQNIEITGRLARSDDKEHVLLLESEQTDHMLRVSCHFVPSAFPTLPPGTVVTVLGLCTGVENGTARLDETSLIAPRKKEGPRLTVDFLPHKPGTVAHYDIARYTHGAKPTTVISRYAIYQTEGGLLSSDVIYLLKGAKLPEGGLLQMERPTEWIKKAKKVRVPGPVLKYRIAGGFVEMGQPIGVKGETIWEPLVKLEAAVGDSWEWTSQGVKHRYTLTAFTEHHGRPAAVVDEVDLNPADEFKQIEIRHIFVVGLGETERREVFRRAGREEVLLEKRQVLAEELTPEPPTAPKEDSAPK
jgi:hypothetical protein